MIDYSVFDSEELYALVKQDMDKENFDTALYKLKLLFARRDFPIESFSLAGRAYASMQLFAKARVAFKQYLELDDTSAVDRFQLGMVERDLGNAEEAIETWSKIDKEDAPYPQSLFCSAEVFIEQGNAPSAKDKILELLDIIPVESDLRDPAENMLSSINIQ